MLFSVDCVAFQMDNFFCTSVGLEYIKYLKCLMRFLFIDPSDLGIVVTDASVQSVSFVHYASLVYM